MTACRASLRNALHASAMLATIALTCTASTGVTTAQERGVAPASARRVVRDTGALLAKGVVDFRCPDGSRCLLVPDTRPEAPALICWAVVTPCGIAEDPAGQLGLSRALLRSSLNGTTTRGSKDQRLELDALSELDAAYARALAATGVDLTVLEDLEKARERAARLGDRGAWRAELAAAPAVDIREVESPRATTLLLTTTAPALPRVARLLWDRRENPAFRGVHELLVKTRAELRRLIEQPGMTLRRELLGIGVLGDPGSRRLQTKPSGFTRADLATLWRSIAHPARSTHVLTGSFDPDEVRELLETAFATTGMPASTARTPPRAGDGERRSSRLEVPAGQASAAVIGLVPPVDADASPSDLEVLAAWLEHGPDAVLRSSLEGRGYPDSTVSVVRQFPESARPGMFLIEFRAADATESAPSPATALQGALQQALERTPPDWVVRVAVNRAAGARAAALAHPVSLAELLAHACGVRGERPTTVLEPIRTPTPEELSALLRRLWNAGSRLTVEQVPGG